MPTETARLVGERYRLLEPLGRGGMGLVWRADDTLLNRPVAVKEVEIPTGLPDQEKEALQARVLREARAAARLNHPNVVTVFDVVEDEGRTFIVMELIEAPTLAEMVEHQGSLSPARAREVALEVLSAIEAAHAEGIVHRDVKPGNVMIPPAGRVKLGDFGIASVKGDPKLTSTGLILGSPSYMAPEQATSATSGPEADLWALGALLYFAVEGEPPFDKGQALPTLAAVVGEEPKPLGDGPLRTVVEALMRKEPAARPSIAEVRSMLLIPSGAPTVGPTKPMIQPDPQQTHTAARSKRPWAVVGALGALLLAAALLMITLDRNEAPPTEPRAGQNGEPEKAVIPPSWVTYKQEAIGFTIAHPGGWQVEENSIDDSSIDFLDPDSSTYLRLDWTDTPGDSPAGAWRSLEQSFEAAHSGYSRIGITPTTFKGMDAATWEFTYVDGGVTLHAIDLGFVTSDGSYGFALNFQTLEEDWAASQPIFEQLKASFQAPG
ncbi:MAG TPA: serine/threonine-protein kinase [Actinomycetota bacterium]|nr:serine/threonine-protein kinase [Actinomycetota bacterium]